MKIPENLIYSREHEWIKVDGDCAYIGITDFAQSELGDIVFIEFPEVGSNCNIVCTSSSIEKLDNLKSRYIFALSNEIRSTCTFGVFTRNVLLDDVQTENGKPQSPRGFYNSGRS